jgi:hypothetical protein
MKFIPPIFRGKETAEILQPIMKSIEVKGMGLTIPTRGNGIEAEAIVVDTLEELRLNKLNVNDNQETIFIIYFHFMNFRLQGRSLF